MNIIYSTSDLIFKCPKFSIYFLELEQQYIIIINLNNNFFFKWIQTHLIRFKPLGIYTQNNTLLYELPQEIKQKYTILAPPLSDQHLIKYVYYTFLKETNKILNESIPDSIKLLINT